MVATRFVLTGSLLNGLSQIEQAIDSAPEPTATPHGYNHASAETRADSDARTHQRPARDVRAR